MEATELRGACGAIGTAGGGSGASEFGAVEGENNRLKLTIRTAFGYRTFKATEIGLYHAMGDLPELPMTHRFC
jgi:hypothetical protein